MLAMQSNLATTYADLGRHERALQIERDVYSERLKLQGEEHVETLMAASNYADCLMQLKRFEEAKALFRNMIPMARRVLRESPEITLSMRWNYAMALYEDPAATLDDLREAATTLEDSERTARRVLGGSHPTTGGIERHLRNARAALHARETPSPPGSA